MGAVTTNPILIAIINMTVVFAVLYGLSLVIRLIQLIDPTKKKQMTPTEAPKPLIVATVDATSQEENDDELMILFTAAIAAYGQSGSKIVAIRPVGITTWSQNARMEGIHIRDGMS